MSNGHHIAHVDLFDDIIKQDICLMLSDLARRVAMQRTACRDKEDRKDLDEYGTRIIANSAYLR